MKSRTNSGQTSIAVIILASMLLAITTAITRLVKVDTRLAQNHVSETQAMYLAEAGLTFAEAMLKRNPEYRDRLVGELATGSFEVDLKAHQPRIVGGSLLLPVESIGRAGNAKQTLIELFSFAPYPRHPVFDCALFQSCDTSELTISPFVVISGDIHANGPVSVADNTIIHGSLSTGDESSIHILTEHPDIIVRGAPCLELPEIDWRFYANIAATIVHGPTVIRQLQDPECVFVYGDAVLGGCVPAGTTIVCTGHLRIEGDTHCPGLVLLLAGRGMSVQDPCTLTAVLCSPCRVQFQAPIHLKGCIAASQVELYSGCTITYLDADARSLSAPLPGLTITRSQWYRKHYVPSANSSNQLHAGPGKHV